MQVPVITTKDSFKRESKMSENTVESVQSVQNVDSFEVDNPYAKNNVILNKGKLGMKVSQTPNGRHRIQLVWCTPDGRVHNQIPAYVDVSKTGVDAIQPMHENFNLVDGVRDLLESYVPTMIEQTNEVMGSAKKPNSSASVVVRSVGKTERDRANGKASAPTEKAKSYTHPRSKKDA